MVFWVPRITRGTSHPGVELRQPPFVHYFRGFCLVRIFLERTLRDLFVLAQNTYSIPHSGDASEYYEGAVFSTAPLTLSVGHIAPTESRPWQFDIL
jgi:hypothetical protein